MSDTKQPAPLYIWRGREQNVGFGGCVATELVVTSLMQRHDAKNHFLAFGTISTKDYMEHRITDTADWEAVVHLGGVVAKQPTKWTVWRKPDPKDDFWKDPKTGEYLFTLADDINDDIKEFVSICVCECAARMESGAGTIINEPGCYTGPKRKYEGPCVCNYVGASNTFSQFPWQGITYGEFPANCFECSCGSRWWCYNPIQHQWIKVSDERAWEMFTTCNGLALKVLWVDPQTKTLSLLDTYLDANPDSVPTFGRKLVPGGTRTVAGHTITSLFHMVPE